MTETTPSASPPNAVLFQLLFGKHVTTCLSAVARLGVADHMGPVPVAVDELAAKTSAHGPSLYRVLRLLASLGVFAEHDGRRFSTTDVGQLLKTNAPNSLRSLAIMYGDPWTMRPYEHLTHSVRTGGYGVHPGR